MGESSLQSAENEIAVRITEEENPMALRNAAMVDDVEPDREIRFVDIDLTDEKGNIECNADRLLELSVEGAELLAFGSANPKTEDDFLSGKYHTYFGQAQAVLALSKESKQAKISIYGEGLEKVTHTII